MKHLVEQCDTSIISKIDGSSKLAYFNQPISFTHRKTMNFKQR